MSGSGGKTETSPRAALFTPVVESGRRGSAVQSRLCVTEDAGDEIGDMTEGGYREVNRAPL